MRSTTRPAVWIAVAVVGAAIVPAHFIGAQGTPRSDLRFAHAENAGWLNFRPTHTTGVTVTNTAVTGHAYSENIGWINFSPSFGGIANDGTGRLSGYAWGENVGWINLAPAHGGVTIDACGDFNGHAWGENIGWISFRSDGAVPFRVRTPWVSPIDGVPPETTASTTPALATWNKTDVSVQLTAEDCGTGADSVRYAINGAAEVSTAGSAANLTLTSEGTHSITYYAVDGTGNTEAPKSLTVRIDKTFPFVDLRAPTDGAQYFINQAVVADFSLVDALSGVVVSSSTVPDGAPLDTSSPGPRMFNVTAVDAAGNTTHRSATYTVVFPGNIDPNVTGAHFAYGENVGWINLRASRGPGITVTDTAVIGFGWSENIGWVNLSPENGGVTNDGAGNLAGYAWSENAGWISFSCANTNSCARVDYRVRIDPGGKFTGHAWGENIGWIRFASTGAVPFGAETSWKPPDVTPPVVTCPADIVVSTAPGLATAVVNFTPTATDDGPSVSVVTAPASGATFLLGVTTVTAIATDAADNSATCSFTVTVRDTEPPAVSCPADIVVSNDAGQAGAVVSFMPTAIDNVPGVSLVSTPASGSFFALGAATVVTIATDAAGNSATCSFTVGVNDTEPPVVTAPPDITAEATSAAGAVVADAALGEAAATDNAPGVTVMRAGVPPGNLFPLGTTSVTYTATDTSGNTASAVQQVSVQDTTPPVITIDAPGAGPYVLNQSVVVSYTCVDAVSPVTVCAGPVASGALVDTGMPGSHPFTVGATDAAGNTTSATVTYVVSYGVCLLYDPTHAKRAGSTIPIKLQLCDAVGRNVSRADVVLSALDVVKLSNQASTDVEDAGNANPDADFRFDPTLGGAGGYIFNLKTTGLTTGTYVLKFRVSGDPTVHGSESTFQVR